MTGQRLYLLALGLALAVALAALRLADPAPVAELRSAYFDGLQRSAPRAFEPVPVRVVDIDEASLAALGQWPWPRDRMAELTRRLAEAGAAVVVHDILYAEPDRRSDPPGASDRAFAEALASVPSVLGTARSTDPEAGAPPRKAGVVEVGSDPAGALRRAEALTPVLPELAGAAAGIGAISLGADAGGGPVRSLPLMWSGPEGAVPTLALEALRVALGETTYLLEGHPGLDASLAAIGVGEVFVPTGPGGEMWLHYRHEDPARYLPAHRVLAAEPAALAPEVGGRIVFIGTSAAGLLDIRRTALGEVVPGVAIHAQALEQLLLGRHLARSDATGGFELLALVLLAAAITLAIAFAGPLTALATGALGTAGLLGLSWAQFRAGWLFDASFPLLGGFLAFAALTAFHLVVVDRERRLIRRSLAHYVAPEVVREIERSGFRPALGGEARDVTVLFADLRGFTGLSEALPPDELVALLNALFDAFGAEIMTERGTIDKFIGDAVMAFWNAPLPLPDHPARAVAAALRIRAALRRINSTRAGSPLRLAIGIATGPASVGNIGSKNRFNYSVVGETVNLAARVEAACRPVGAGMLITDDVARAAPGLALLDAGRLGFRGLSHRVQCHAVAGGAEFAAGDGFARLSALHAALAAQLATGAAPDGAVLAEARDLAGRLDPGLAEFFAALPGRAADYRD